MLAETCRSSWTDKTTLQTKDTSHKTDTNKKFLDKGDGRAGVRIKGEVKRGGTEKMKKRQKESERLQFQLFPCRCLFRHQPSRFQKGPVKEGASCPQPTGVINLETSLLYVIWGTAVHRWNSYPSVHQNIEICHFSTFLMGFLMVAGNWRWEYWDSRTFSHYRMWGLNLYLSHKSHIRESPLDQGFYCVLCLAASNSLRSHGL